MKKSLCQIIAAITVLAVAGLFLTTGAKATWDRASSHIVTVDVHDIYGAYCHTYGYSYYVPDTTTNHYTTHHMGPAWAVPDAHPSPHTATITGPRLYEVRRDLDTYCDGTLPNYQEASLRALRGSES